MPAYVRAAIWSASISIPKRCSGSTPASSAPSPAVGSSVDIAFPLTAAMSSAASMGLYHC